MADTQFFRKTRRGNEREIVFTSPTGLSNANDEKRIKIAIEMPLTGTKLNTAPEWLIKDYEFVSKDHAQVKETDLKFSGFALTFVSEQALFGDKEIVANKCLMKGFTVKPIGAVDDPEVVLSFNVWIPFSTKLWNWMGQMYGDPVWVKFEYIAADDAGDEEEGEEEEAQGDLALESEDDGPEETDEPDSEEDLQDEEGE